MEFLFKKVEIRTVYFSQHVLTSKPAIIKNSLKNILYFQVLLFFSGIKFGMGTKNTSINIIPRPFDRFVRHFAYTPYTALQK